MRANLIYNPNSGLMNGSDPDDLVEALKKAGYDPVYEATAAESDLDGLLENPEGMVLVAGGDGTVRAAATRLLGKNVPLAIVPMGTANNIAKMFSIGGSPVEIIAGLRDPKSIRIDIGRVQGPWGNDYFIESFGFGFYAEALSNYQPQMGRNLARSILAGVQTLRDHATRPYQVWLDGQDISGEYHLVEALNINSFGPRLNVAPKADPSDGLLEVVCVGAEQRDSFIEYLMAVRNETFDELGSVEVRRGLELVVEWSGFPVHFDAELPHNGQIFTELGGSQEPLYDHGAEHQIRVRMLHRVLELWLPCRKNG
jgi:diacylglycerol kinase (ATP)